MWCLQAGNRAFQYNGRSPYSVWAGMPMQVHVLAPGLRAVRARFISHKNGDHFPLFVPPWHTLTMNAVMAALCVGSAEQSAPPCSAVQQNQFFSGAKTWGN